MLRIQKSTSANANISCGNNCWQVNLSDKFITMEDENVVQYQSSFVMSFSEEGRSDAVVADDNPFPQEFLETILKTKENPDVLYDITEPLDSFSIPSSKDMSRLDQSLFLNFPLQEVTAADCSIGNLPLPEHSLASEAGPLSDNENQAMPSAHIEPFELSGDIFDSFSTITSADRESEKEGFFEPATASSVAKSYLLTDQPQYSASEPNYSQDETTAKQHPIVAAFFPSTSFVSNGKNGRDADGLFPCDYCVMRFKQTGNRKKHIEETHMRRKPFSCTICKTTFSRKHARNTHERAVHQQLRPYACPYCQKLYKNR